MSSPRFRRSPVVSFSPGRTLGATGGSLRSTAERARPSGEESGGSGHPGLRAQGRGVEDVELPLKEGFEKPGESERRWGEKEGISLVFTSDISLK